MTQRKAKQECASLGFSLTRTHEGDYRLCPYGLPRELADVAAYYADSLDDAVETARNWQ